MAGAATIVRVQAGKDVEVAKGRPGWIALALVAGAILPIQGAVNALLRVDIGAPICAFSIGTTELVIVGLLPEVSVDLGVTIPTAGLLVTGYGASWRP